MWVKISPWFKKILNIVLLKWLKIVLYVGKNSPWLKKILKIVLLKWLKIVLYVGKNFTMVEENFENCSSEMALNRLICG